METQSAGWDHFDDCDSRVVRVTSDRFGCRLSSVCIEIQYGSKLPACTIHPPSRGFYFASQNLLTNGQFPRSKVRTLAIGGWMFSTGSNTQL